MANFIRLPNQIVNLDFVMQIMFEGDAVILYWSIGSETLLKGQDAAALLYALEHQYGLMTNAISLISREMSIGVEEYSENPVF